ncbi:MAG: hypothetical protein HYT15_01725 [Candidatus Magasanikbacteria bacterium]|nr:hypothetical protein [Candidatus Magasanikbacteria bacterium]
MLNVMRKATAGSVMGVALFAFLKTKKGQQVTKELKHNLDDLYQGVEQKLRDLGDATEEKYKEVVELFVKEYSQKKMLAVEVSADLTHELQKRWLTFQLYYLYNQIKNSLRHTIDVSRTKFNTTVDETVLEYGRNKHISREEVALLMDEIKKKWKDFKEDLAP